ncbi:MAG: hypothetical protein GXO78_04510 [Calditrichaeota bacterium]|nr:hypothetical protein [Calditrichota bacterium]
MEKQLLQYGFTFLLVLGIVWFLFRTTRQLVKSIRGESSGCHGSSCSDGSCCSSQPREQAIPIRQQEWQEEHRGL